MKKTNYYMINKINRSRSCHQSHNKRHNHWQHQELSRNLTRLVGEKPERKRELSRLYNLEPEYQKQSTFPNYEPEYKIKEEPNITSPGKPNQLTEDNVKPQEYTNIKQRKKPRTAAHNINELSSPTYSESNVYVEKNQCEPRIDERQDEAHEQSQQDQAQPASAAQQQRPTQFPQDTNLTTTPVLSQLQETDSYAIEVTKLGKLPDVPMAKVREKGAARSFRRGSQCMKAMTTSVVSSHDKSNFSQTFDRSIQSVQSPSEINNQTNQISPSNHLSYQPAGSNPQQLPHTVTSPSIPTISKPATEGSNTIPNLQKFLGLCKKF